MKKTAFTITLTAVLFTILFTLFCGDPINPLDPDSKDYKPTTVDIISDNTTLGDSSVTITTEEALKLGIQSNFTDRIDSILIDFDTSRTDQRVTIKSSDLGISSGTQKIDLKNPKIYSIPGTYTVKVYAYTTNNQNVEEFLTVNVGGVPPHITAQPEDTSVEETGSTKFRVSAEGTKTLRYFWHVTADTADTGKTITTDDTLNSTYSDDFVELSDSGFYYCIVKNDFGIIRSKFARLNVTLQDLDSNAPSVSFSAASTSGSEKFDANISLKLSTQYEKEVVARISVLNSSFAKAGSDYKLATTEVVFPAYSTSANLPIDIIDDDSAEGPETIIFQLDGARNARVGEPQTHTYTIADDDLADSTWPELSFVNGSGSGIEGENASITVGLNLKTPAWESVVSVNCRVSGSASSADYKFIDTVITFNINEVSQRISLQTIKDKISENDETVRLTLSNPVKAVLSATMLTEYTYTIQDGNICYINFESMEISKPKADTTNTLDSIWVTLSNPSVNEITVKYVIDPEHSTAINQGTDYLLPGDGIVKFRPGDTLAFFLISITGDTIQEGEKIAALKLADPTGGAVIQNSDPFKYIILDPKTISLSFKKSQSTVLENVGDISIPVTLSGLSNDTIQVDYRITGNALGTDAEYVIKNDNKHTLTFLPREQAKNIEITIIDNKYNESNKSFTIQLEKNANSPKVTISTLSAHTVTILDNDVPYFSFDSSNTTVNENVGKVLIPVHLSNPSRLPLKVRYTLANSSTATPGEDFVAFTTDTAMFNARDSIFNIELAVIDNNTAETDETVVLTLSPLDSTTSPGSHTTKVVTIVDNDGIPTISFSSDTMTVDENAENIQLPVVFTGSSSLSFGTDYRVESQSAQCDDIDFSLNYFGRLNIDQSGGANYISVSIKEDKTAQETDTFTIALFSPQNAAIGTKSSCRIIIRDNDYSVTILSAGGNGTVSPVGVTTITRGDSLPITASASPHYHFTGWSGRNGVIIANPSAAATTIKASSNIDSVLATFAIDTVEVTFSVQNGTINPNGSLLVPYGTVVTPVPSTTAGYKFIIWTISSNIVANGALNDPATSFIVNGNGTIAAGYSLKDFLVTVRTEDARFGSVTPSVPQDKNFGESIDIVAIPAANCRFIGWSSTDDLLSIADKTDSTTSVIVKASGSVTALFAPDTFTLQLSCNPTTMGTVDPAAVVSKNFFDSIPILAIPKVGYAFTGWSFTSGAGKATIINASIAQTAVKNLSANVALTANFVVNQYAIVITPPTEGGTITADPAAPNLDYGTTLKLTANPATGWHLDHWTGGVSGTSSPVTVTVSTVNQFSAVFAKNLYTLTINEITGIVIPSRTAVFNLKHGEPTKLPFITFTYTNADSVIFSQWESMDGNSTISGTTGDTVTLFGNAAIRPKLATIKYPLTVVAHPTGGSIGSSLTAPGNYDYGTSITLTATSNAGYHIVNWTGGTLTGNVNPITTKIGKSNGFSAVFALNQYTLTFVNSPGDTATTTTAPITNINWGETKTFTATAAINPRDIAKDSLTGKWIRFDGDVVVSGNTVVLKSDAKIMPEFVKRRFSFYLTVPAPAEGDPINANPGVGSYEYGQSIKLTATAKAGYDFDYWTGGDAQNQKANPYNATLTATTTYGAIFKPKSYTLTISSIPEASVSTGTFDGFLHGIPKGFSATVTPDNAAKHVFNNDWEITNGTATLAPGGTSITLTSNATIKPVLTVRKYSFSLGTTGSGTVTASPNQSSERDYGTVITFTAAPATGWMFSTCSGGNIAKTDDTHATATLTGTTAYSFVFVRTSFNLTITTPSNGKIIDSIGGVMSGTHPFPFGFIVKLKAVPDTGYQFGSWTGTSGGESATVTMDGNKTVGTNFSAIAGSGAVYVWKGSTGTPDGTSWAKAYRDLNAALNGTAANKEVWIARGVYSPANASTPLGPKANNVKIYGGFNGFETVLSERKFNEHFTVINGLGYDYAMNLDYSGTYISGCVFTNAKYTLNITQSSCTVEDCIFKSNTETALTIAGGSTITANLVNRCVFHSNAGTGYGALYIGEFTNATKVVNSVFTGNEGPAIYNQNHSTSTFDMTSYISCTIAGNTAHTDIAGGIYNEGNSKLKGCIVYFNASPLASGKQINSTYMVQSCDIESGTSTVGIANRNISNWSLTDTNFTVNPNFNSTPPLGTMPADGDWYSVANTLPLVPNATLNNRLSDKPTEDLRNKSRPSPCDMGAYEK